MQRVRARAYVWVGVFRIDLLRGLDRSLCRLTYIFTF